MRRSFLACSALCLGLVSFGCGSGTPSAETARKAVTDTTARLEGNWQLVSFQPAQPLEPMLQSLLNAQLNQLVVTFHVGTMSVHGVGLDAQRGFSITSAANDDFSANITDPTNVVYQVNASFDGADVDFTSVTDPWRGQGKLARAR